MNKKKLDICARSQVYKDLESKNQMRETNMFAKVSFKTKNVIFVQGISEIYR